MYDKYADDIFRYLLVRTKDRELAEDLTAEAFTRAWSNIDRFDYKHSRGWLYKIAQNLLTDHWRKKKSLPLEHEDTIVSDSDSLEELTEKQLNNERLQAAVSKLPIDMQSVITMRFILGYSAKKTGESLGIEEGNVRVIQYRALRKLKKVLI